MFHSKINFFEKAYEHKARFVGEEFRKDDSPTFLVNIGSIDNFKQNGLGIKQYVNMVNAEEKIKKNYFLDTTFLHRHYDRKNGSQTKPSEWYTKNKNEFENLIVQYEVIDWKDLIQVRQKEQYEKLYELIKIDFYGDLNGNNLDIEFRKKVLQLVSEHLGKGTQKQIILFLLEECAGACVIKGLLDSLQNSLQRELQEQKKLTDGGTMKGYATYPGVFNVAIQHVFAKYKVAPLFVKYKLDEKHLEKTRRHTTPEDNHGGNNMLINLGDYRPTNFGLLMARYADTLIPPKVEVQHKFTQEFFKLCENYKNYNKENVKILDPPVIEGETEWEQKKSKI